MLYARANFRGSFAGTFPMTDLVTLTMASPVGWLAIRGHDDTIVALDWVDQAQPRSNAQLLNEAAQQLEAYFSDDLQYFDLPLDPQGTDHQKKVWNDMLTIPYGGLRSYGDMAKTIGSSARAVGTARGKNPIPIIVPCHRVIATGGGMGGYSGRGGLETKRALLILEGVMLA